MSEAYIALDLETTGLDPHSDEIIEIAAVRFRGGEVADTFHTLVQPHRPLPLRIQSLTGIAQHDLDAAPALAMVLGDLLSFIGPSPIVGQSVGFDLGFLSERGISLANPVFDTCELATILLPTLPDYRLSTLAERLAIPFPVRHRALPDALAAKDVFEALLAKGQGLDRAVIAELRRLSEMVNPSLAHVFSEMDRATWAETPSGQAETGAATRGLDEQDRAQRGHARRPTPTSPRPPLDIERLASLLGPDGTLAQAFPGFEHRPQQVRMMEAVAQALGQGGQLIVEAGTGIGKSIAYLLPAALFAAENDTPVVVSTNTINLQEQLVRKDIPDLLAAVEQAQEPFPELRFTQLKGRGNYLCRRRWESLLKSHPLSPGEAKFLMRITVWAAQTPTGDRAEINLRGEEAILWNRIAAHHEGCLGARCPHNQQGKCFLHRARQEAEGAHLIVINHALLLSDLADSSRVLPEYRHLIIDEAHNLEEEATEQWGFEVTERDVERHLCRLSEKMEDGGYRGLLFAVGGHLREGPLSPALCKEIAERARAIHPAVEACRHLALQFFDVLWHFVEGATEGQGEYERRLRLTGEVRSRPEWRSIEAGAERLGQALGDIEHGLAQLHVMLEPLGEAQVSDRESLMMELASLIYDSAVLRQNTDSIVYGQGDGVYWAQLRERGSVTSLCAAPLHIGQALEGLLFSQKEAVVLTSATLSTEGTFEYIRERLGLEGASELVLGSPFDYMGSAMVYVPDDIPEPGQPGYQQRVEQALIDLCSATRGRALVLFTSHAALKSCYEAIWAALHAEGITVLGQGIDGPTRQLVDAFRTSPQSVLLGTASLREGIDVVGEALSVLVIARLPFSVPNDPVFAARAELYSDPFNEYAIPQAVLRFRQGFGRLIRSRSDRGVLVVLDRRIRSRSYGSAFLGSLPPCAVKSGASRHLPREATAWLEQRA